MIAPIRAGTFGGKAKTKPFSRAERAEQTQKKAGRRSEECAYRLDREYLRCRVERPPAIAAVPSLWTF